MLYVVDRETGTLAVDVVHVVTSGKPRREVAAEVDRPENSRQRRGREVPDDPRRVVSGTRERRRRSDVRRRDVAT